MTDDENSLPLGDVRDQTPLPNKIAKFVWRIEQGTRKNANLLGRKLSKIAPTLFRQGANGHSLVQVLATGHVRSFSKAGELAPLLVDCLEIKIVKEGKVTKELLSASVLNMLLKSEVFLRHFRPVDAVVKTPVYGSDFSLIGPGYHDGGEGNHVFYHGPEAPVMDSIATIERFLDVMEFDSNADRTNTVAAALTVLLRNFWPGEKPVVLVTATKSHAGKGTVIDFIGGSVQKADILYQGTDWPMQTQFQKQVQLNPEIGLINIDNVRVDSSGGRSKFLRSAYWESFVTTPEVVLSAPGNGDAQKLKNHFVLAINTNDGVLSTDLMNRALPIHLSPTGDVHNRITSIGNPKLEFLPNNRDRIEAELRGMIERWKRAGCPLDENAQHPMTPWAKTVGGILKVSGFSGFLANVANRKVASDPVREALSIMAADHQGKVLSPMEWGDIAHELGLSRTLFSPAERDTGRGRERAIGVVLKRHLEETFEILTDTEKIVVRLDGGFRRWVKGQNARTRYRFEVLHREVVHYQEALPTVTVE